MFASLSFVHSNIHISRFQKPFLGFSSFHISFRWIYGFVMVAKCTFIYCWYLVALALSHLLAKLPGICMFIMLVRRSFSQLHIFYSMFCFVIYTNFLCAHGLSNVNFHFSLSLSLSIKWTHHRSFSSSVELSITELVLCVRRIIKPIFINASDPAIKYRCRLK